MAYLVYLVRYKYLIFQLFSDFLVKIRLSKRHADPLNPANLNESDPSPPDLTTPAVGRGFRIVKLDPTVRLSVLHFKTHETRPELISLTFSAKY